VGDFKQLYEGQWRRSIPDGLNAGVSTNASLDLQFSMERLSASPFSLRRLHPTDDELPFEIEQSIVSQIAGEDLDSLHSKGQLFFVDHSVQLALPKTTRYSAACSAYFFIHSDSGSFLPLAIKTNTEFDLIYTPRDSQLDWTLAKIMMNSNEAIFNEAYHVAAAHAVQEIVHLAAVRTLSAAHPVLALLDRMMVGSYAPRPMGEAVLTNPGGVFDTYTSITGTGGLQAITLYYHYGAGAYQSNYFITNLESRGLINCTWGPPLQHYPFFEDTSSIYLSLHNFMKTFVESYYPADSIIVFDHELQDWIKEGTKAAKIIDFPDSPIKNRQTLIDMLTHFAYLTVVHNTLNGGDPVSVSSSLPYHPASLHAPLPSEKGVTDIMPWLPNVSTSIGEIALFAKFNRPVFESSSFLNIFNDVKFLGMSNNVIRQAEQTFRDEMNALSSRMKGWVFDADGLHRGMPSIWNALDPTKMALSSAI